MCLEGGLESGVGGWGRGFWCGFGPSPWVKDAREMDEVAKVKEGVQGTSRIRTATFGIEVRCSVNWAMWVKTGPGNCSIHRRSSPHDQKNRRHILPSGSEPQFLGSVVSFSGFCYSLLPARS